MCLKKHVREFAHRLQSNIDAIRVALSKNTDCTDAHGWVFSRITTLAPLPTAWSLMRPGATDEHGSFACGKLYARKNICANLRDLWETTKRPMRLKKQMREFVYRSQSNTDAMRGDFIKKH